MVLRRNRLSVAETVKKKRKLVRERSQIDRADWGRGLFTFPRLLDYTKSGLKRNERDKQCERRERAKKGVSSLR